MSNQGMMLVWGSMLFFVLKSLDSVGFEVVSISVSMHQGSHGGIPKFLTFKLMMGFRS